MNPGDILKNRYRILKQIGKGGFGLTYLAEDTHLPVTRHCVVKEVAIQAASSPNQPPPPIVAWIYREAGNLYTLGQSCEQIPELYAFFDEGTNFYLVQEFIEGDTLAQQLNAHGPFSEDEARDFLMKFLPVLDYIHSQGAIHRDIKPQNIIVRRIDGTPVLIDFGAVKELATVKLDAQGNLLTTLLPVTPGYAAPEQVQGKQPVFASDIYSVGMTTVNLLTGMSPQSLIASNGEVNWETNAATKLTPEFTAVINKAVQHDYQARYQTAQEMLTALMTTVKAAVPPTSTTAPASEAEGSAAVKPESKSKPGSRKRGTPKGRSKIGGNKKSEPKTEALSDTPLLSPSCLGCLLLTVLIAAAAWYLWPSTRVIEVSCEPQWAKVPNTGRLEMTVERLAIVSGITFYSRSKEKTFPVALGETRLDLAVRILPDADNATLFAEDDAYLIDDRGTRYDLRQDNVGGTLAKSSSRTLRPNEVYRYSIYFPKIDYQTSYLYFIHPQFPQMKVNLKW